MATHQMMPGTKSRDPAARTSPARRSARCRSRRHPSTPNQGSARACRTWRSPLLHSKPPLSPLHLYDLTRSTLTSLAAAASPPWGGLIDATTSAPTTPKPTNFTPVPGPAQARPNLPPAPGPSLFLPVGPYVPCPCLWLAASRAPAAGPPRFCARPLLRPRSLQTLSASPAHPRRHSLLAALRPHR